MALCVRSRENSASMLCSLRPLLPPCAAGAFSCVVRCSSSRIAGSRSPRSVKISAAKHFSSRSRPSSRCSVPICLCESRSASSAA